MDTGNPKSFRPQVVQLEAREVPAVASIQLVNSVLTIQTTNDDSNVSVVQNPFTVAIRDSDTNRVWNYSRSQVNAVQVFGGLGNDTISSTGNAGVNVQLYGKGGNDTLDGDGGANLLIGGPGNDRLYGRGGDDTINGGVGNDFIFGGIGNDVLNGQDGDDTVIGGQGADAITGGAGDDVLVSIDGTNRDVVDAGTGTDTAWVDNVNGVQESVTGLDGTDFIRPVAAFANGADLTLTGDRIANPALVSTSDSYETFTNRPLFPSAGPTINDINQTSFTFSRFGSTFLNLDDSWLLGSLGSMIQEYPNLIKTNVVDFGDGTYGVRFNGTFYRVDNELPVGTPGDVLPAYAGVGVDNSLWVAVIEKAVATASSNLNPSYTLIDNSTGAGILPATAFALFGAPTQAYNLPSSFPTADQLGTVLKQGVASKFAIVVTVTTVGGGATLERGQSYSLTGLVFDTTGTVTSVILRNPTGVDGGGSFDADPNDGYVTISINNIFASTGTISFGDFTNV
ncbi:MAG: hypothetical protein K8U57_25045 [Planctomycetes bacterium]|nr:hypothetical protein [Planctomycetota bacterium]